MARLQNPESQTVYASYMVRFVCFYLRIIEDDERRLQRAIGRALASPNRRSDSEEDSEDDSEENSSDGRNSEDGNKALQSRRTTRRQGQVDMMKDARELFTFTAEQQKRADTL